jgi:hypothetical protein
MSFSVTGADKHLSATRTRELNRDVAGGTEAIQT